MWISSKFYTDLLFKDDEDDYHPNSDHFDYNSFEDCE